MKGLKILFMSLAMCFGFALVVHAAEKEQEGLTKKEYDYLLNL
ncbi:hypothetical protein J27TS8_44430 [Robertmurraya siralis]|uniref:Uncharacterized protein n=1 Tax=Robertmurraya siralis TaxID=77777 RepID=A0A919WLZ1_9BACI|nr:hypothetical protein [Robertmurraya siralis]GIN64450.1 hypothetical protein J27TS8_44430 [Robertmurraya siralis]